MPTKKRNVEKPKDSSEQILSVLQDLFILQALDMGMNVEDIRKTLKVGKWKVSNISKLIKNREKPQKN
jgi:hypothetical protein